MWLIRYGVVADDTITSLRHSLISVSCLQRIEAQFTGKYNQYPRIFRRYNCELMITDEKVAPAQLNNLFV